jgi:5-methylthioadenosine/S-adenosylhomocysteine deaminase
MTMQILSAKWVVPGEGSGKVLEDHSVVVLDDKIHDIIPTAECGAKYPGVAASFVGPRSVLLPGMVNCHTHSPMTLLRGLADDLKLMEWLQEHIWPAEGAFVSPEFVRDGTDIAIAEMLKGGTTCFNDMYFFPDEVAKAAHSAGMRARVGIICIGFPSAYCGAPDKSMDENIQAYLDKGCKIHAEAFPGYPLVDATVAPHAPYTCGKLGMETAGLLARKLKVPYHIHLHETCSECSDWEGGTPFMGAHHKRPVATLEELGLIDERLVAVHMTQLNDDEIKLLADNKAHVVHCPESNMKLASGSCPVARLVAAGVNVALGTDGCASNNDLDMYSEMRSASLLSKHTAADPEAVPAHKALYMATMGGARALGLEGSIGSLEVGKQADMQAVSMEDIEAMPLYNVLSHLVYCTQRSQVTDVWVAGQQLVRERQLTRMDEQSLKTKALAWGTKIAARNPAPP